MACSKPGKRICSDDTANDVISHLPQIIKQIILTKLPIKDAVRTGVLSTNWRNAWASIPEIVVKEDDLIPDGSAFVHFVEIIDCLLFIHKGPILKCHLSMKQHCPEAIDRWILKLSRNEISELNFLLDFTSNTKYRVPSNLFLCHTLQHVDLSRCLVKLPRPFEGLKLLTTLRLNDCIISGADIERLVSTSPQLVELLLENIRVEGAIRIYATGLTTVKMLGYFLNFQIDAPRLECASIGFSGNTPSPEE